MKVIGLVGGVASGKSRVGRMLVERGAGLLDADRAGHAVLEQDTAVQAALRRRWGDGVFKADGSVDRGAIARRVFGTGAEAAAEREFLEGLLHPRIRERLESDLEQLALRRLPAVVLDAPLLLEAGWDELCDTILFVDASRETRLARARTRGWSETQFDEREGAQWPIVKKRSASHAVISNDGSEEELRDAVNRFWTQYISPEAGLQSKS